MARFLSRKNLFLMTGLSVAAMAVSTGPGNVAFNPVVTDPDLKKAGFRDLDPTNARDAAAISRAFAVSSPAAAEDLVMSGVRLCTHPVLGTVIGRPDEVYDVPSPTMPVAPIAGPQPEGGVR